MEEIGTVFLIIAIGLLMFGRDHMDRCNNPDEHLQKMTPREVSIVMADGILTWSEVTAWAEGTLE